MTYGERLIELSTLDTGTADELYRNITEVGTKLVSGTIRLQRGKWQLISIPLEGKFVKEYLIDRLALQEAQDASDLIEVVNTYRGTEDKFFSYVVGVTADTSEGNFPLVYDDNGSKEIAGVWVKMKDYTHTTEDLLLSWNMED